MHDLIHEVKLAFRSLKTRPGGSLTVIATLAVAVGATTAVFSVVQGVLLAPLPYPGPERLVQIWQTEETSEGPGESRQATGRLYAPGAPAVREWQAAETGFEAIGAYVEEDLVEQQQGRVAIVRGQEATSDFFKALQVPAKLGRTLQPEDDDLGAPRVAVVSEKFWQDRFGGSQQVLGATLILDDVSHTVVGVMPETFSPPIWDVSSDPPRLWIPLGEEAYVGDKSVRTIGRLELDRRLETAASQLGVVQARMAGSQPSQAERGIHTEPLLGALVGQVTSTIWFLFGSVALVLLIAAANIANVLAVQGLGRGRELAVRAALGAGRLRLVRGLLVESTLLAVLGGLFALVIAWASLPPLVRLLPPSIPRSGQIGITPVVLLGGIVVTAMTALLVGSLPAFLAARIDPQNALRAAGRGLTASRSGRRARSFLVTGEVALSFVLLISSALLAQSYARLWSVDRGFETEGLVAMTVIPDPKQYGSRELEDHFITQLSERLNALPGVQASVANNVPLSGDSSGVRVKLESGAEAEQDLNSLLSVGLPNYLDVLGVPVQTGRKLDNSDSAATARVAMVNEAFANRFWGPNETLGKRLRVDGAAVEIVGVTANLRHKGLGQDISPKVYLPASQSNRSVYEWVLRLEGPLGSSLEQVQQVLATMSPSTPVSRVLVLEESIAQSVAVPRFRTGFVTGLALLAVGLALLGVYGILSFAVAQQRQEIGVRMALGAGRQRVILRVVAAGLRLTLAGVAIGALVSWVLAQGLQQFLFNVAPHDLLTYLVTIATVTTVGALAALLPAWRAAGIGPMEVLKD